MQKKEEEKHHVIRKKYRETETEMGGKKGGLKEMVRD